MDADAVVRRAMEVSRTRLPLLPAARCAAVYLGEQDDLGTNRVDSLPLEYNSRHLTYQPSRVKVVQNAESREASSVWTGKFSSRIPFPNGPLR